MVSNKNHTSVPCTQFILIQITWPRFFFYVIYSNTASSAASQVSQFQQKLELNPLHCQLDALTTID